MNAGVSILPESEVGWEWIGYSSSVSKEKWKSFIPPWGELVSQAKMA